MRPILAAPDQNHAKQQERRSRQAGEAKANHREAERSVMIEQQRARKLSRDEQTDKSCGAEARREQKSTGHN